MAIATKICCIVDPFRSSTELICDTLLAHGIWPVAILTGEADLSRNEFEKRFIESKFKKILHYRDQPDIQKIANQLQGMSLLAVIAGDELTCFIADQIAAQLTPSYANDPVTSFQRMDKFEMQDALFKAGLPSLKQVKLLSPNLEKETTQSLLELTFPLIVKPTRQCGSFGFSVCKSINDIESSLRGLMGTTSQYGYTVNECVAQEYITGTEYSVDTVSLNGQHKIVGVYRYPKIQHDGKLIFQGCETIDPTSSEAMACIAYVKKTLTALNLNYGMAHTELFLTTNGPRLMETNPRIVGGSGLVSELAKLTTGIHQADLFVQSLTDQDKFLSSVDIISPLFAYGRIALLHSWHTKIFHSFAEEKLKKLPSFKSYKLIKKIGDALKSPSGLHNPVAIALLSHPDEMQLKKDCETLFLLEKNDQLFE